jgi:rubrerythrin
MDETQDGRKVVSVGSIGELNAFTSRRGFLRLMGLGGALVLLPSIVTACNDDNTMTGPVGAGTGNPVTIDFSQGDVAVLQLAYALEQLEADFYSQVVANFAGSNFVADEQSVLTDIRNHEVIHRDFLKTALGSSGSFTLLPWYGSLSFTDRTQVLNAAKTFEDLGVAAYNGAAQYLSDASNLLLAGKIVSVEARHASAIRDLINPRSADFAPRAFDDALRPSRVATSAQMYVIEQLTLANAPTAFVQGPNNNG